MWWKRKHFFLKRGINKIPYAYDTIYDVHMASLGHFRQMHDEDNYMYIKCNEFGPRSKLCTKVPCLAVKK